MKMDIRAMAITTGLLWGGGVLMVEAANRVVPSYGSAFLKLISSCYPGYKGGRSAKQIALGAGWAVLDGASAGLVFALLYNALDRRRDPEVAAPRLRAAS